MTLGSVYWCIANRVPKNWSSAQVIKHSNQWPGKKHKTMLYRACRWHNDCEDADGDDGTTELSNLLVSLAYGQL